MQKKLNRLICPQCDETRIKTPSGAVCPNGHGKVQLRVTTRQLKSVERIRWALSLPKAERAGRSKWKIEGEEGLWEMYKINGRYSVKTKSSEKTLAVIPSSERIVVRKFRRI